MVCFRGCYYTIDKKEGTEETLVKKFCKVKGFWVKIM